jgi:hypothetical protein
MKNEDVVAELKKILEDRFNKLEETIKAQTSQVKKVENEIQEVKKSF